MEATGPNGPIGTTVTINGSQYYIIGKNRIKITEHFPAGGKQLDELISELIIHKIKENADRTA